MNKNITFNDVLHITFWFFLAFLHPCFFAYFAPKMVNYSIYVGVEPLLWLIPLIIVVLLSELYCCNMGGKKT